MKILGLAIASGALAIIIVLLFACVMFFPGNRKKNFFIDKMIFIDKYMRDMPVNKDNYDYLKGEFREVFRGDVDHSMVMYSYFVLKYQRFVKAELIQGNTEKVREKELVNQN